MTLFDTETREPIGNYQAPSGGVEPRLRSGGRLARGGRERGLDLRSAFVEILDAETARVRTSIPARSPARRGPICAAHRDRELRSGRAEPDRHLFGGWGQRGGRVHASLRHPRRDAAGRAVRRSPRSMQSAGRCRARMGAWSRLERQGDLRRGRADAAGRPPLPRRRRGQRGDQRRRRHAGARGSERGLRLLDLRSGRVRTLAGGRGESSASGPSAPTDERSPPGTRAT